MSDVQEAIKPLIACICGSTRFHKEIEAVSAELTLEGYIVVAPEVFVRSNPAHSDLHDSEAKVALDELHLAKINMADVVVVVAPGGYIGESTRNEINYAGNAGKRIVYRREHQRVEPQPVESELQEAIDKINAAWKRYDDLANQASMISHVQKARQEFAREFRANWPTVCDHIEKLHALLRQHKIEVEELFGEGNWLPGAEADLFALLPGEAGE